MTISDIDRLIQLLAKLPGLGPRSARRATLHLLKKRETLMQPLANDLIEQLTGAFWEVQAIVAPALGQSPPDLKETARLHVAIVEAAETRDTEALQAAVAAHYEPVRNLIRAAKAARAS